MMDTFSRHSYYRDDTDRNNGGCKFFGAIIITDLENNSKIMELETQFNVKNCRTTGEE